MEFERLARILWVVQISVMHHYIYNLINKRMCHKLVHFSLSPIIPSNDPRSCANILTQIEVAVDPVTENQIEIESKVVRRQIHHSLASRYPKGNGRFDGQIFASQR